jgi:protein KRI1
VPSARPREKAAKPVRMLAKRLADIVDASSGEEEDEMDLAPTHVEEQARLRDETIAAFHAVADDGDADDLLQPREKTQDEVEREEAEYRRYLEREVEDIGKLIEVEERSFDDEVEEEQEEQMKEDGKSKKKTKKKKKKVKVQKQQSDQEFLMKCVRSPSFLQMHLQPVYSYILNRGWIDRSAKRLPTFDEVTGGASSSWLKTETPAADTLAPAEQLADGELDEDDFDEVAEVFESSFNFRFEEPCVATRILCYIILLISTHAQRCTRYSIFPACRRECPSTYGTGRAPQGGSRAA